jgi:hypothetical protein
LTPDLKRQLAHILWIGGAPDCGKTSIARSLGDRFHLPVYHYGREDAAQVERLAQSVPEVRRFQEASLEERWVQTTPQRMFEFLMLSFSHRFELVLESLVQTPGAQLLIVEGFGLLPELLKPALSSPNQALWLAPTRQFKRESMERRGKPSFAAALSNPQIGKSNLLERDLLLGEHYRRQAAALGLVLYEVDGSRSLEEMVEITRRHFAGYHPLFPA